MIDSMTYVETFHRFTKSTCPLGTQHDSKPDHRKDVGSVVDLTTCLHAIYDTESAKTGIKKKIFHILARYTF